ncbi:MAG: UvrD-helicase domain-containing protein, partial [Syntrophomonas sp.]
MTWTSEQEEAIYSRNKNLLVTAAAGAGKTAVLVERIIQMIIKDQIDIDRLLIVTFTNAAAAEMRERISAGLLAEIEKDNGSNRHLRKQINLLPCSAISTLHSFCSDIVRKHFHLVNIDPSFRIADSTESELIKNELLEDLFESEYEISSEIFLGLVEMFGANINDYPLQELVLRLYNFIQSQPYPIDWLRKRSNDFSVEEESFEKSVWVSMLKQDISIELQTSAGIFCEARRICELAGGPLEYRQAIIDDLHIIELLQQALESGLTSFYSLVNNLKHSRLARIPKKAAVEETLKEQVKSLREDGKKILAGLRSVMSRSPGDYCHELNKLQPFMSYLAELVEKFSLSYRERKAEKAILDFNDLEHLALEILSYEAVADEYRLQYKFIFVDEYQDSNLVQDSIINLIKRDDNLFMVGDVKQSIYRFRLADPSLFMEKQDSYNREDSGQNCRIDLNMNFRSRSPIIAAVNYLFGHLMTREFGEIDYGEDAYLRPGLALDHYLKTGDKKAAMDGENLSLLSPLPELYVIENNLIIEEQRE